MSAYSRDLGDIKRAELALMEAPLGLYDMARYQAGLKGRTRHLLGLLCLAACRAVDGDSSRALPAAAALDMVGGFFALHKDLWSRRLSPVWRRWGQHQAINVGDALFSLARLSLLDLERKGATPARASEALRLMDEACLRVCWGRSLELRLRGQAQKDRARLEELAREREGVLLQCCTEMGALLGGASKSSRKRLGDFGERLGAALFLRKASDGENAALSSQYHRGALEALEASLPSSSQAELRELASLALGKREKRGGP